MKKNKLSIAPFDDIHLIGINTTLADYKLAYYFNELLRFNLVRLKEIQLDGNYPYAFFYYNAGENRNAYNLVALKSKDHLCVKLNPHIDYLLIVRNHLIEERLSQLVKLIRDIKDVTYAYTLDINKIPAFDVLLEKIEMHERDCIQQTIAIS